MTKPHRGGLMVLGGLLASLVMGATGSSLAPARASVPVAPLSASAHASEVPDSPTHEEAPHPGTEIVIEDPSVTSEAVVELTGDVVVAISEDLTDAAGAHTSERVVSVETESGHTVTVTGSIPDTVATGDAFEGTVAVDAPLTDMLAPHTARQIHDSPDDEVLSQEADASQEIFEAAAASGAELAIVEARLTTAAAVSTTAPRAHEIVIVVNTPAGLSRPTHTDNHLRSLATRAGTHWKDGSNGLIPQFTVAPTVTRTSGGTCGESPFDTWNRAAQALGHSSWSTFRTSAQGASRHLVVFTPTACSETGVGIIGSQLHYGGAVRQKLDSGVDASTLTHELGHNLGLGHSNLAVCSGASCTQHEYWDIYDVMGLGIVGHDALTPLNASTASRLGFSPSSAVVEYSLPSGRSTQTWAVSLAPAGTTSGVRNVALTDPVTGQRFHIELRDGRGTPTPYYGASPSRTLGGQSVSFTPGVRLLQADGNGSVSYTTRQSNGRNTAAALPGQVLKSPSGGITVDVVSGSATTSMRLNVTLGAAAATPPSTPAPAPAPAPAPTGEGMPVYRFWSDTYQGHFYTISDAERAQILRKYPTHIWKYEAVAYQAYTTKQPGTVPLYRFWSNTMNGHFYTASESEKNHVIAAYDDNVWKYESVAYYVYPNSSSVAGTRSVYRFWSDTKRHHFYTASAGERDHVIRTYDDRVWKYEAPVFKVPTR